jgi:hypothetical protein
MPYCAGTDGIGNSVVALCENEQLAGQRLVLLVGPRDCEATFQYLRNGSMMPYSPVKNPYIGRKDRAECRCPKTWSNQNRSILEFCGSASNMSKRDVAQQISNVTGTQRATTGIGVPSFPPVVASRHFFTNCAPKKVIALITTASGIAT